MASVFFIQCDRSYAALFFSAPDDVIIFALSKCFADGDLPTLKFYPSIPDNASPLFYTGEGQQPEQRTPSVKAIRLQCRKGIAATPLWRRSSFLHQISLLAAAIFFIGYPGSPSVIA